MRQLARSTLATPAPDRLRELRARTACRPASLPSVSADAGGRVVHTPRGTRGGITGPRRNPRSASGARRREDFDSRLRAAVGSTQRRFAVGAGRSMCCPSGRHGGVRGESRARGGALQGRFPEGWRWQPGNGLAGPLPWEPGIARKPAVCLQTVGRNAVNPRSAAGCNKPAPRRAEETVQVVRNHEGGTGSGWLVAIRPKRGRHRAGVDARRVRRWRGNRRVVGPWTGCADGREEARPTHRDGNVAGNRARTIGYRSKEGRRSWRSCLIRPRAGPARTIRPKGRPGDGSRAAGSSKDHRAAPADPFVVNSIDPRWKTSDLEDPANLRS